VVGPTPRNTALGTTTLLDFGKGGPAIPMQHMFFVIVPCVGFPGIWNNSHKELITSWGTHCFGNCNLCKFQGIWNKHLEGAGTPLVQTLPWEWGQIFTQHALVKVCCDTLHCMDIGTTGIINANVWISGGSSDGLGNLRQQVPFDFGGMSFCFVPRVLGRIIVVMFWKHGPKYLTDLKWLCLQFCAVYIDIYEYMHIYTYKIPQR